MANPVNIDSKKLLGDKLENRKLTGGPKPPPGLAEIAVDSSKLLGATLENRKLVGAPKPPPSQNEATPSK